MSASCYIHGKRSLDNASKPICNATAPYNFIPYVHEAVLPPFPVDENTEYWSGTIRCSLNAWTPLLVAGPQQRDCSDNSIEQRRFFMANGKPVIPGSSLKGMIRSLVEIMSFSYMRPLNNTPLFWRLVNRESYRHHFDGTNPNGKNFVLKGGYLQKHGAEYQLFPVAVHRIPDGTKNQTSMELFKTGKIQTHNKKTGAKRISCDYLFGRPGVESLNIDRHVVETFRLQLTQNQKDRWKDLDKRLNDKQGGLPVFYILDENEKVSEIGLCRYFRLKYKKSPADLYRHDDKSDFASALFGTAQGESRKGKVAFESAIVDGEEGGDYITVLGTPRPTCLAHYVDQSQAHIARISREKNDPQTFSSYMDDIVTLRGRKWYWHRNVDVPTSSKNNPKTQIRLIPFKAGAQATVTIRVDAVTSLELGALLTALELPEGHAHKLGLGKSLGFGSVRIAVEQANVQPTTHRYASLTKRFAGQFPVSLSREERDGLRETFKTTIANAVQAQYPMWQDNTYETLLPIKTLRTMMDFKNRPENSLTNPLELKGFKRYALLRDALTIAQQAEIRTAAQMVDSLLI